LSDAVAVSHLLLDFLELRPHAVASGFPFDLELSQHGGGRTQDWRRAKRQVPANLRVGTMSTSEGVQKRNAFAAVFSVRVTVPLSKLNLKALARTFSNYRDALARE
jgi:hypothetical protein